MRTSASGQNQTLTRGAATSAKCQQPTPAQLEALSFRSRLSALCSLSLIGRTFTFFGKRTHERFYYSICCRERRGRCGGSGRTRNLSLRPSNKTFILCHGRFLSPLAVIMEPSCAAFFCSNGCALPTTEMAEERGRGGSSAPRSKRWLAEYRANSLGYELIVSFCSD